MGSKPNKTDISDKEGYKHLAGPIFIPVTNHI